MRMFGYKGGHIGCDISPKMLTKFLRGCFDDLFIQGIEKGLHVFKHAIDVLIITGAHELLNINKALFNCFKERRSIMGFFPIGNSR